ncbi:9193_t:CDS:2 [Rhizophagus irregularis]|nr:9193_t:CDS:2 [Rhizophagus irregularis]
MDVELEEIMLKCNSMNDIRKMAEKTPSLKEGLKQNLNPMITLLNDVFEQLQLKDENFKIFEDASELDIDILWNSMLQLDPTLTKDDRNWANIKNNVKSSQDIFNTLDHLPDPVPANNEHYKNFSDVYHMDTSESYCPSIQAPKNVGMTVTCIDCNKSRCLYASKKITEDEKKILMAHLDTVCYTCGTTFSQNDNGFKMELEDDSLEESSRK